MTLFIGFIMLMLIVILLAAAVALYRFDKDVTP